MELLLWIVVVVIVNDEGDKLCDQITVEGDNIRMESNAQISADFRSKQSPFNSCKWVEFWGENVVLLWDFLINQFLLFFQRFLLELFQWELYSFTRCDSLKKKKRN